MRRLLLSVVLAILFLSTTLDAQNFKRPNGLEGKVLFVDHYVLNEDGSGLLQNFSNGFEAGYHRHINNFLTLGVPFKVGVADIPNTPFNNRITVGSIDAVARLRYFSEDAFVVPYLFGGAGLAFETDQGTYGQIPVGLGVNFKIGPWGYITAQGEYRATLSDIERNNIQIGIGFMGMIGKPEPKPEVPAELEIMSDKDTDEDGVLDKDDACPTIAGVAAFAGCPDTDGDGIADSEDKCPDVAGIPDAMGCPDADGDGYADQDDECPDVAGILMGCPDTDGDGTADKEDECPDKAGSIKGCPDIDSDGIADKDDKCPEVAGVVELNGCPESTDGDADGDGFRDSIDECPNSAGTANGCPDRDNDGVADRDDSCPSRAGFVQYDGCPDTDGDSVGDHIDACPNKYGPATNSGCPEIKAEEREVLNFAMQAVQFETGSDQLKFESYAVLDQIVTIMQSYSYYNLKISGHTDNVGDEAKNLSLSERRAKSCMEYIKKRGISDLRLSYIGYGETRPISDNDTYSGRQENRRVEFDMFVGN